ncbi:MAG: hypothetical protein MI974_31680 [Chitinophagales bacterium]|nr:hypothetical protein [Chitinophagales bacterium]
MKKNELIQLLKAEYLHIQTIIEDFDKRALTIKAWSISFSLGALGAAFAVDASIILLVASLSSVVFWLIEIQWKTFQQAYYSRVVDIERYFRGEIDSLIPLQTNKSWLSSWKENKLKKYLKILTWPHVAMPHILVAIFGLILYILVLVNLIEI